METMKMTIHSTPQHRLNQFHNVNNNNNSMINPISHYGQTSNSHLADLLNDDTVNNNNLNSMAKPGMTSILQSPTAMSECAACRKPIKERFLLKALDQLWHEDCLKCACCDCRLGEVGSTLFTKANLILCKRDYLRLFGNTGMCSACSKTIPAFEMVMKAPGGRVYHLECFQCAHCNHRFCIGDRFHLHDNRILCEYDYEELACSGMMSNNGTSGGDGEGGSNANNNNNNKGGEGQGEDGRSQMPAEKLNDHSQSSASGQQIRPAVMRSHEDGSSGYGSPDSVMSDSAK